MEDDVNDALENLQAIKQGEDPRSPSAESASMQSANTRKGQATGDERIVQEVTAELRRTFDEYPFLREHLSPGQLEVFVAGWKRRRGWCWCNRAPPEIGYGSRVTKKDFPRVPGTHAIGLARKCYEDDLGWEGTIRHEIAHAYLYEKHGELKGHGKRFKRVNDRIDGSEKAPAPCDDYDYGVTCPNRCFMVGRFKRSKTVQKPFKYTCEQCDEYAISFDWGNEPPTEAGTCAVSSIDWSNEDEWVTHPTRSL